MMKGASSRLLVSRLTGYLATVVRAHSRLKYSCLRGPPKWNHVDLLAQIKEAPSFQLSSKAPSPPASWSTAAVTKRSRGRVTQVPPKLDTQMPQRVCYPQAGQREEGLHHRCSVPRTPWTGHHCERWGEGGGDSGPGGARHPHHPSSTPVARRFLSGGRPEDQQTVPSPCRAPRPLLSTGLTATRTHFLGRLGADKDPGHVLWLVPAIQHTVGLHVPMRVSGWTKGSTLISESQ